MENTDYLKSKWFLYLVAFELALSSYVLIEPSPYDIVFVIMMFLALLFSLLKYRTNFMLPLFLLFFYLICNLYSMFFAESYLRAIFYCTITLYLVITWIFVVGVAGHFKEKVLPFIFNGYTVAAVLTTTVGVLAYFHLIPNYENYLIFDRVKGFSKDPNVFGPFLIPPALYMIYKMEHSKGRRSVYSFILFAFLSSGIFLSFSRAAWAHYALSLLLYFFFWKTVPLKKRLVTLVIITFLCVPGLVYFVSSPFVADLFQERIGLQGYDAERFGTQVEALRTAVEHPFGIGPGQSEVVFDYSTHSLYARVLTENGFIGIITFMLFYFICLVKVLKMIKGVRGEKRGYYVLIAASLIGILFNSLFIDTLHWRHLWLLLGLAWCPYSFEK
ncbi:O-antigen ligase family protein [Bacillus timonensis]|nr:O-antigen ligase family protein [Bacillus timonensis]